jgi:cytochrome P450
MAAKIVVDFDQHSAAYAADPWKAAAKLAKETPVAWTNAHGGYWIISGSDQIREAARNPGIFSVRHDLPNGSSIFQGINIPSVEGRYLPIEIDPPEQLEWRRALAAPFSQGSAEQLRPIMEQLTTWCIDRHIESGEMDFVMDLSSAVPALLTLHVMGLPMTRWHDYVEMTHKVNYETGEAHQDAHKKFGQALGELAEVAHRRRLEPKADLLTVLAKMEIGGKLLTDEQIVGACGTIVAGGIDTTSAVVASALKHLGENPMLRQRLIANPNLMPSMVEEFLRYVTPVTGLARTAAEDVEFHGQHIQRGDRVLFLWHGANMDEKVYSCPTKVDPDRDASGHVTFGFGSHRCLGSAIARQDVPCMLGAVLRRMPDYQLVPGKAVRYPSVGTSNNYISIPVTFTPGPRLGVSEEWQEKLAEC